MVRLQESKSESKSEREKEREREGNTDIFICMIFINLYV